MNFLLLISCFLFGSVAAQEITSTECNVSKGCFRSPSNCTSSSNCDFMVTYQLNKAANTVSFELSSKAKKWVALGLGSIQSMVGTRGEICIEGASGAQLQGFFADKYSAPQMFPTGGNPNIVFEGLKSVNGALVCRFTRSVASGASYQTTLNKKFYFVVASGDDVDATDAPSYHKTSRTFSPVKYNVAFPIIPIQTNATTTAVPTTTELISSNTTTTSVNTTTTTSSNTTITVTAATQSGNATTESVPTNSTTVMPSAEPSTTLTPSNSSSVTPSAQPETTPSAGGTTNKPGDNGSGMIAPTTFVTIACLIFARMSS